MAGAKPGRVTRTYGYDDYAAVAAIYVVTGNALECSRQTGIPNSTISGWLRDNKEFNDCLAQAQKSHNRQLDGKLSHLLDETVQALKDRVKNGDIIIDKDGNKTRKPMTGKDLSITTGVLFDKRSILRHQPVKSANNKGTDQTLAKLADWFEKAARGDNVGNPPRDYTLSQGKDKIEIPKAPPKAH